MAETEYADCGQQGALSPEARGGNGSCILTTYWNRGGKTCRDRKNAAAITLPTTNA